MKLFPLKRLHKTSSLGKTNDVTVRFQEDGPQDTGSSNADTITTELAGKKVPPSGETSFLVRMGACVGRVF